MGRGNEWTIRGEDDGVTEMCKDEEERGSVWAHG